MRYTLRCCDLVAEVGTPEQGRFNISKIIPLFSFVMQIIIMDSDGW